LIPSSNSVSTDSNNNSSTATTYWVNQNYIPIPITTLPSIGGIAGTINGNSVTIWKFTFTSNPTSSPYNNPQSLPFGKLFSYKIYTDTDTQNYNDYGILTGNGISSLYNGSTSNYYIYDLSNINNMGINLTYNNTTVDYDNGIYDFNIYSTTSNSYIFKLNMVITPTIIPLNYSDI
jgi:hypothetical protein